MWAFPVTVAKHLKEVEPTGKGKDNSLKLTTGINKR